MSHTPVDHRYESNGLDLHYVAWGDPEHPLMLIHHGFMDQCRAWDAVAARLADDWYVCIPDARGHGDSQWIGAGGTYYFPDYVYDLVHLREAIGRERAVFVGHSLGGSVMSYYAAAYGAHVRGLVIVEGMGPPPQPPALAGAHLRAFVQSARKRAASRVPSPMESLEEAAERLHRADPLVDEERAMELATHATRPVRGGVVWKFDPLHRARMGMPFVLDHAMGLWRSVKAPVLYIRGGRSRFVLPDERARLDCFSQLEEVTIPDAGHNVHAHAVDALVAAIAGFVSALPE